MIPGKHNRAVIAALINDGLDNVANKLTHLINVTPVVPAMNHSEWQLAKRGVPINKNHTDLAEAYLISNTPDVFLAEIAKYGYLLAQGEKVPLAITRDGQQIPLLRAINVGLKSKELPRIKKSELQRLVPINLLPSKLITSEFDKYAEKIKDHEQICQNCITTSDKHISDKWKQYRQKLLSDLYNDETANRLSQYWQVYQLRDGSIMLNNKAGRIIDRGNVIHSHMDNDELAAKVMVEMALARDWDTVKVTGSDNFKQAHFSEAMNQGLKVHLDNKHDQAIWDSLETQSKTRTSKRDSHKHSKNTSNHHRVRSPLPNH